MNKNTIPYNNVSRKQFLQKALTLAGGAVLFSDTVTGSSTWEFKKEYTVQEIIDSILKEVPGAPFASTVDTLKSGSGNMVVTGIITTMFTTLPVIEQANKLKANFIIAHEPTFYNHEDDKDWVKDNSIVKKKAALLEKNKITVWRFHDYSHALKPDAISYGVAMKTGWLRYYNPDETILKLPPQTLQQLCTHLKKSLGIPQLRVLGNLQQKCETVALLPGAWGGKAQVSIVEEKHPDVLIVGEISEWETGEYIRDCKAFGAKTALIILGHSVSEEPGMEWVAQWMKPKFPGLKIQHIASGNPFTWV